MNNSSSSSSSSSYFLASGFDGQSGWTKELFLDQQKIEDYICSICLGIVRDPVETPCCGHLFCEWCLNRWYTQKPSCPCCRDTTEIVIHPSHWHRRFIANLQIHCPLECGWDGCISKFERHDRTECPLKSIQCDSCHDRFLRCDLTKHEGECPNRMMPCPDCQTPTQFSAMDQHQRYVCLERHVECPNQCHSIAKKMSRRVMMDHIIFDCPFQVIPCPLAFLGCEARLRRCDTKEHCETNMSQHTLTGMIGISRNLAYLQQRVNLLERVNQTTMHLDSLTISSITEEFRLLHSTLQTLCPKLHPQRIAGVVVAEKKHDEESTYEARTRFISQQIRCGNKLFHCRQDNGRISKVEILERQNLSFLVTFVDEPERAAHWIHVVHLSPCGIFGT